MVELLIGKKGTGKTKALVDKVNTALTVAKGNVVFIAKNSDQMYAVDSKARMATTSDFDIRSYNELLGFIYGIISRDYDITNIFVDGIFKIVGTTELDGFEEFLERLEDLSRKQSISFVISVSIDADTAPEYIKELA
ncbi:MAG: twitching motility protein PilT [Clostridia bacterium]|nr:twitching motility protein PilT [Clostridia bacterium]MBQ2670463.1 twitching motility protein PilT [Clostridia bacterium]MBQ3462598.1 twitching motility protein PilT [Clostridia bacterium]MBQ6557921.1 twitching motility protein PilT [Clostridia bacterium]MBR0089322.1 twitching motility protein PilT [Clostridia bacterium]